MSAKELKNKYPWVVPGTLLGVQSERSVLIKCTLKGCSSTRRVRTAGIFQVKLCKRHQREQDERLTKKRKKRWRARQKAIRGGTHNEQEATDT